MIRARQHYWRGDRSAALRTLADKWPDEGTRKLLPERAVQDDHQSTRSAVFEVLANKWSNEATRNLLTKHAVHDDHYSTRLAILRVLAEKWPDDNTRKLLAERAVDVSLTGDQRGQHAVVLGKMHSEFGRITFTRDLDGIGPYLDPAKPISRAQIVLAA